MAAAVVFAPTLAVAQGAAPPNTIPQIAPIPLYVVGAGLSESCAAWLSSPAKEAEGAAWILGYWSGLNRENYDSGHGANVGHTLTGPEIVAEVKRRCQESPSWQPIWQAQRLYGEFERQGR
jgi:hypothetical protein